MLENSAGRHGGGRPGYRHPLQWRDALTYALTGKAKDSGLFVIDSATGQISVAENAVLDYETDDTHREIEYWPPDSGKQYSAKFYRGTVSYTVDGHASSIEVLIVLNDVDETKPTISTITRTRFSAQSAPALDVTWVAPTQAPWTVTGYNVQYRKQGETAWTAYSGTLSDTDTTVNLPGLELGATYEVQVRATGSGEDEGGTWSETATGRANRAPVICCLSKASRLDGEEGGYLSGIPYGVHRTRNMRGNTGLEGGQDFFTDPDGDELTYAGIVPIPGNHLGGRRRIFPIPRRCGNGAPGAEPQRFQN